MLGTQREKLAKVQEKLAALHTLDHAFQTALDALKKLEPHTFTRLTGARDPLTNIIRELETEESVLLRSIDHLENK